MESPFGNMLLEGNIGLWKCHRAATLRNLWLLTLVI